MLFSWQELKNGYIKSRQKWWLYNAPSQSHVNTILNWTELKLLVRSCSLSTFHCSPSCLQFQNAPASTYMYICIYMIMYSCSVFKIHCSYVITSIHLMHIYNLILSFWVVNIIFYALKENLSHQNYCWCLFFLLIIGVCVCVCVCVCGGVCVCVKLHFVIYLSWWPMDGSSIQNTVQPVLQFCWLSSCAGLCKRATQYWLDKQNRNTFL